MAREPDKFPPGIYLVSTPIGNLEDISERQRRVLEDCDVVACEDTRRTGQLLARLSIKKSLLSYHEHNESARAEQLAEKAEAGERIAVVSDAGTPGISDPAYRVVRAAVDRGVTVYPVPGPSAVVAALVASGLPTDRFVYEGFLPQKGEKRWRRVDELLEEDRTVVLYESPHRVVRLIEEISNRTPSRPLVLAREITKLHEEFLRGTASELANKTNGKNVKGECVLLIGPKRMEN
ncbi:MAG: 16S rRNA (cytidine(1402)-2'-O)-methyltransferase [Nitrospinaceae bacterium]|jgi:16S rRNA (cytidine1402-2'-O)-methyltransferase|nr:16S rRNA (cytidine(1402)-2'-O)-methyltransferase [Nitrospinaceae bacterium]MBT3432619.1 16S rRNA (cytidine(1402)-2'-O)-methyltransferase [Nitrospinaceae bacterium]MBT4094287.1 16S rRNA (cytidine(1402)-2'-O)-methyltransferase [Nitrospinaceae bacterium]MBT4429846.1 16S rRNA (cytidine(1402)-2'-O)-methyltransferase [Nitrospinaceae bacterium]MBT5366816.1 16S rRNA (cytidine(1402)-2'-O)-methyltransferase [Nitrospinaceae bacterium]